MIEVIILSMFTVAFILTLLSALAVLATISPNKRRRQLSDEDVLVKDFAPMIYEPPRPVTYFENHPKMRLGYKTQT